MDALSMAYAEAKGVMTDSPVIAEGIVAGRWKLCVRSNTHFMASLSGTY